MSAPVWQSEWTDHNRKIDVSLYIASREPSSYGSRHFVPRSDITISERRARRAAQARTCERRWSWRVVY